MSEWDLRSSSCAPLASAFSKQSLFLSKFDIGGGGALDADQRLTTRRTAHKRRISEAFILRREAREEESNAQNRERVQKYVHSQDPVQHRIEVWKEHWVEVHCGSA